MIVLYSHQKGGVGKSTLAINHAYAKTCPVIDLDSQNSSMLFNQLRAVHARFAVPCHTVDNIDQFLTLTRPYKANKGNMIIVDSGGYDSQINRLALIEADIVITPVGASQIELFGLQKFRGILNEANEALGTDIVTNVLINNVDSRSKKRIHELQEYITHNAKYFSLLQTIVHARIDFKNAYGDGLTVMELDGSGKAAEEIATLVREVDFIISKK